MKDPNIHTLKAVALAYDDKVDTEPRVVAKGKGNIAQNIIEEAQSHNIPIKEDNALVELLGELHINESIPEDLYRVVAEIFAFIYKVDQEIDKE